MCIGILLSLLSEFSECREDSFCGVYGLSLLEQLFAVLGSKGA
jgi:hypothetical protein